MAKEVKAKLGENTVLVSMLVSRDALTIYPYISETEADMTVLCAVEKQDYLINEESGMIELQTDWRSTEKIAIKPALFDEITKGKWD